MYLVQDDPLEETGWKLVHGDVFRPPKYPTMLVVCIGSGIQILSMVLIIIGELHERIRNGCLITPLSPLSLSLSLLSSFSLSLLLSSPPCPVFAMFGMLSPASRGALMTAAIVLFMFMG